MNVMIEETLQQTIVITNPQGFHVRPIQKFALRAMKFQCEITVIKDDRRVDGRSVLDLLTLGAVSGTKLTIEAAGPDAHEAIPALVAVIENYVDEESA